MIYIFIGNEEYLIKNEINNLIKENKIDPINKIEYDLETTPIKNIIDDAQTISMFGEKKLIQVNNSYIFTGTTKKNVIEQNLQSLEEYIEHKNPDTILIFITNSQKLDERKKIVKNIKKQAILKDFNQANNLASLLKTMFEDYQISYNTINLLIDRVGNDLFRLNNEIEKIKTYKGQDLSITDQDIIDLTNQNIDLDIFNLIDHIINKNKGEALKIYNEMLKMNEEPIKIIIMLANQFRLMYQSKELYRKGHTESDTASILNVHPYRVKLAVNKARDYPSNLLLKFLNDLANIDYQIKNGTLDKNLALELFILKL